LTLPAILPALVLIGVPGPTTTDPMPGAAPSSVLRYEADQATPPVAESVQPPAPAADSPAPAIAEADPLADGRNHHAEGDPLEGFNRAMFSVHQKLDKAMFRPAAMGYRHVVPKPVRSGLRNFFSNLGEPIVALNYLLQLKFGKVAETLGRFAINTTLGFGGLFDIAKGPDFKLPHRSNGFGNTLAFYGVGPGPYLFLPLVGPTNLRDFLGGEGDGFVLPVAVGKPFDRWEYQFPKGVITGLDLRAESDDDLRALMDGAVDPYATLRSAYQQSRQGDIDQLRGKPRNIQSPELGEPLDDPAGTATVSPPGKNTTPELSDPLADPAAKPPTTSTPPAAGPDTSDPLADPATAPPVKR
jgi:phospholipid-binding lipoprotein MlaA